MLQIQHSVRHLEIRVVYLAHLTQTCLHRCLMFHPISTSRMQMGQAPLGTT